MKPKMPRVPIWCLPICLIADLTLLAATTCPHVSWLGQIICGTMGTFLLLSTATCLFGHHNAERLARSTQDVIRTSIDGGRHFIRYGAAKKPHQERDRAGNKHRKRVEPVIDHGAVQIGAVLGGRYRVERVLGQGGMGIVVQAMHLHLHQPVAMKFLLPEVLANQQVVQRFLREAQAAFGLKSEHVARVIDVGALEIGAPYLVLEYLEGADLSSFPRSQLTVGRVVDLLLQACEVLAEAHALGIVHRDIKPANLFITRGADGTLLLKVLDFGISKLTMLNGQLTATQTVMGTPAYMSPEQMRSSRDVDYRSDIWSLGVVLYELLQGAPPFGGNTFSSMVIKVVSEPLPKLTVRLPGDLDAIVYRCLEKDPAKRFQNTAELAQALAKYAQSAAQAAISVQRTRGTVGAKTVRASSRGVVLGTTAKRK